MINTFDLMCGDYVSYKGVACKVYTVRDVNVTLIYNGILRVAEMDEIEPIPLTEEILEANGFEDVGQQIVQYEDGHYWVWYELDRHRLGFDANNNTYDGESTTPMFRGVIFNVHELQNALKLCGIDKEIVL